MQMQIAEGLQEKRKIRKHVHDWLDRVTPGREFGPREVQSDVRLVLGENPYEGTITRYIRSYNERNGRQIVVIGPKQRSRYMKLAEVCDAEKA